MTITHAPIAVAFFAALLVPRLAVAAEYYVSTDGDDDNPGTETEPFATVGRGQQAAAPGDTVWVRGGTYSFSSGTVGVAFTKAGQADNLIQYFAYPDEVVVFDLSAINPSGRVTGFDVQTDYIHLRGMEITGVPQFQSGEDSWGLRIRGSNNVIEQMNVHHNEAPGIFITSGSNNLILNCDSHHNYDVLEDGGSGDGFGCHSTGAGNVLSGCRGWANSDDGYDFINAPGACTVEHSWAWRNGWVPDTNSAAGNGAGFKAGGFGLDTGSFPSTIPVHVVRHCVAWNNRSQGFYANHHPGRIDFLNNTAYDNSRNYDLLDDVGEGTHFLRNNVAFGSGGDLSNSTSDDAEYNSWNGGVSLSDADFESLSDAGADGPRQADGGLPRLPFLHLAEGSDLIDAGIDVGLAYAGAAPDLGAFETGEAAADATGGAGGTSTTDSTTSTTLSGSGGSSVTSGLAATSDAATSGGADVASSVTGTSSAAAAVTGALPTSTSATANALTTATTGAGSGAANGAGGASAAGSGSDGLETTATDGSPGAQSAERGCACGLPGAERRELELARVICGLAGLALGIT
ncbi:MAG TPA: right-handed parallel beta-helix repeat-containing protein, partial [Polyangiaceae bacterium]